MRSLVKIFYSPGEVFRRVDESPHWAMPFVTVVVITLIVTAVLLPTVIQPSTVEGNRTKFEGPEELFDVMLKVTSGPRF